MWNTSSTWRNCSKSAAASTSRCLAAAAASSCPEEIAELAGRGRDPHLQPRRRPAHGAGRHDWRDGDAPATSDLTAHAPATPGGEIQGHGEMAWRKLAQLITFYREFEAKTPACQRHCVICCYKFSSKADTRAWHYRHRRRRQIEPDRRADSPPAPGPSRRAAHCGDLNRPVPPQERAARCWATASA